MQTAFQNSTFVDSRSVMKKIKFLFILLLIISTRLSAQDKAGLYFRPITFEEAIQQSKAEKKPIFLHAYASWCHHCEFMADSVYTDSVVAAYYTKNFVCIKLDMEKEGRELNKKLKVQNFPTHVFFDFNGAVMMHRSAGRKSKAEFLQLGKDAQDTTKQLRTFEKKYFAKTASLEETATYFKLLDKAGIDNQITINAYLMGLSDEQLIQYENWRIMYDMFRDVEQSAFQKIMLNRASYAKKYTPDSIENKILTLYNGALMTRVQKLDSAGYYNMIEKLRKSGLDLSGKIIDYAELNKFKMKSDWKSYQVAAVPFIEKYCSNDHRRLNEVAYNFYERITDPELILKAISWSEAAVKIQDNVKNNHTLACLYFKSGNKEKATIACNHTIELAKKNNVDYKQSLLLKDKIDELK